MARFLHFEPCPSCGSRDNLGRYDDGSAFCFGCKRVERAKHAPPRYMKKEEDVSSTPQIPDDTATNFSQEAVQWLAQYHVSVEEAISHGIRWSAKKQQLIFLLEDHCWHARNFSQGLIKRSKYFTAGNINDHIKIYPHRSSTSDNRGLRQSTVVLVEDCVSAIRVSKQCDAMPVLGSHVSTQKIARLGRIYSHLIFWLDHDKLKEARKTAEQAKLLGLSTSVIYTELDPKCYTDDDIKEFLNVSSS